MQDILLDKFNDLSFNGDGDLSVGVSNHQHQRMLLICPKGSFKKYPGVGVGVMNYLEDENAADLFTEIKTQFAGDGFQVNKITIDQSNLSIDAN